MEKNKNYSYNIIEKYAESAELEMTEQGNDIIGEGFITLKDIDSGDVISFILVGGTHSGYLYECIYSDIRIG